MKPILKPLVISAPFGNWISHPGATSTLGTYTLQNRAGKFRWWMIWKILKTLRRHRALGAWTNSLGLPSPGISSLIAACERIEAGEGKKHCSDKILSIHGFDEGEWNKLLENVTSGGINPLAIETNVSCPNVGHVSVPPKLFERAVATGIPVIVKLPPVRWRTMFDMARAAGVEAFHACNTLPTPAGGMSGKPLKNVSLDVVKTIKDIDANLLVIGGGGITNGGDVADYVNAGSDKVAVGSALLENPFRPWRRRALLELLAGCAHLRTPT